VKSEPFKIGLTGSIGMGKSTTAQMFADFDIPVWDADAAVNRLYAPNGAAVAMFATLYPKAIRDGAVDKETLRRWIATDDTALGKIEQSVHPLVRIDRETFIKATLAKIVVLDIPLLFETNQDTDMDLIVVVSAPKKMQHERVMQRVGMTDEQLDLILSRQLPDAEKRARADVVIPTETLDAARIAVQKLVQKIRKRLENA